MGSMSMSNIQRSTFDERIKRIHKGGEYTMGHLLVGSQDEGDATKRKPIKMRKGKSFGQRLRAAIVELMLLPVSFVFGGVAMLVGIFAVYQLQGAGFLDPEATGIIARADVFAALVFAMGLGSLLRLAKGRRLGALLVGVAAAYFLQDALIDTYPMIAGLLRSDDTFSAAFAVVSDM